STSIKQLAMQDAVNGSRTVDRSLFESLSLTETEARDAVQSSTLNEALHVVDTLAPSLLQFRTIPEQLSVLDASNLPPVALSRSMSEQMNLQASLLLGNSGFLQEQLGVSDSAATSQVFVRTISEQLGIMDTAIGGRQSFVMILESLNIQDAFSNIAEVDDSRLSVPRSVLWPDSSNEGNKGKWNMEHNSP